MRKSCLISGAAILFVLTVCDRAAADVTYDDVACSGDGSVCRFVETDLRARVLVRPGAILHAEPSDDSAPVVSNPKPFYPWFIFAVDGVDLTDPENPRGWLQVGTDHRTPEAWLPVADAMLWRTNLVVTYTPRTAFSGEEERSLVLMFNTLEDVQALMDQDEEARAKVVDELNVAIDAGDAERFEAAGVVSREPRLFPDFDQGPYMLPVIDHAPLALFEREARFLRLAAAVPQTEASLGRGPTTLRDDTVRENVTTIAAGNDLRDLRIDIKFVIDMTGSMQPYLDATKNAVSELLELIKSEIGTDIDIRYGLVGYTDIAEQCNDGCRFEIAKDFTSDGPVDGEKLIGLIDMPDATASGGGDWQETMFEGVQLAATGTWRDNALRFVILIGDASSNPFGGPKSSGLDTGTLRSTVLDNQEVRLIALHARPTLAGPDHAVAEAQFAGLALNKGRQEPLYYGAEVDPNRSDDAESKFRATIRDIGEKFAEEIANIQSKGAKAYLAERSETPSAEPIPAGTDADVEKLLGGIEDVIAEQLMEIVGRDALRHRDITVWTTDVDPADPFRTALDVRVLLEKRELSDLQQTLDVIVTAFKKAEAKSSDEFFNEVQAVLTSAVTDEAITERAAKTLASAGDLMPKVISSLPRTSALMELTAEKFASLSVDDRIALQTDLEAKLEGYKLLLENPSIWKSFSTKGGELEKVYPMPLSDLP